jgi:hypothetical protein
MKHRRYKDETGRIHIAFPKMTACESPINEFYQTQDRTVTCYRCRQAFCQMVRMTGANIPNECEPIFQTQEHELEIKTQDVGAGI